MAVSPRDPDAAWSAALAGTDARLILPTVAGVARAPTSIANRVAVYIRGPQASVVDGERAWPVREMINADLLSGRWLLTRDCLVDLLEHPLRQERPSEELEVDTYLPLEPALA